MTSKFTSFDIPEHKRKSNRIQQAKDATTVTEFLEISKNNLRELGMPEDCEVTQYIALYQDMPLEEFIPKYWAEMIRPNAAILQLLTGAITKQTFMDNWPLIPLTKQNLYHDVRKALEEENNLDPDVYLLLVNTMLKIDPTAKAFLMEDRIRAQMPPTLVLNGKEIPNPKNRLDLDDVEEISRSNIKREKWKRNPSP